MNSQAHHFNIYLRPETEGGYTVIVPALPGCVTYGKTVAEAREMAGDAIGAYLESMADHGESVVADTDALLTSIDIPLRA
ncbi:MAG TPA: type II toxin-antitoxin system HicB family antitoxin [Candidatus Andersenbacteria bacterium]|nr:type II toxin-antitoxin system HicB family antitoxin [Candidatus Andersenbacteria bacterium]